MGRAEVRAAVQSAVQAAAIEYVGTVYPARPVLADESAYTQTMNGQATAESASGSACVVVVNIPDDDRTRYADVGRGTVADWWKHRVALELWFASTGGSAVNAQEDYDAVADALVIFIRGNPTMTAPATVWSAGEYTYGVKHAQSAAYTDADGLTVFINGLVRFEAWEQAIGTAGTV